MLKSNWQDTIDRFDRWWSRKEGTVLLIADLRRPAPVYSNISEYTNIPTAHLKHLSYLQNGAFGGDAVPDMSPYLGPGSLSTFIGAKPIYSDKTIWFEEGCTTVSKVEENCMEFLKNNVRIKSSWYGWSLNAAKFYKKNSNNEYATSMPDLQQNLDVLAAVMGADRMFIEMMDCPDRIKEVLNIIYLVWEKAFNEHHDIIVDDNGYSAYTHYNIIGKGKTSILQSDISCMMSVEMFNEFELPFLRKQCENLDNVIYHLDGPGALRHLDSILSIDRINAVQWVPGAGNPGNGDACWDYLYDKIVQKGKGLYVFLRSDEIDAFLEKYGKGRILIRSLAETREEQERLTDKYIKQ